MYWILFVMGSVVAIVLALVVGGLVTPRAHVVSCSMTMRAPQAVVWGVIRDVGAYASWRPELRSSVVDGNEWQESTARNAVRFGITADEPPTRFAARILDEDLPYTGEWEWQLTPHDGGTTVTITERGDVANPIVRFLGAHVFGHTRTIDAFLGALDVHLRSTARRTDSA